MVGGVGSKWTSGSLLSQTGLNCSTAILGSAYTEIMVSGIAAYGGLPSVPKVGDEYWTSFLVSIPGNPCGSGSANVVTTMILPPSTEIDTSRQIRCFGQGRTANTFTELTGGSWSFLNSSGPYCPSQASISPYHQGGRQIGFRPLASGQMFWLFVPVKSSATLIGAGGPSPGHGFTWLTDATGVYANPGRSFVWANVFAGGTSNLPQVYFARDPTVIPFWNTAPAVPDGQRNTAEWFANLYSAGKTGNLCYELYVGTTATGTPDQTCTSPGVVWNGAIPNTAVCPLPCAVDLWQVEGQGPNKGYTPFYYGDNETYTIKWIFTYTGTGSPATATTTFTTLNGADPDGDGVGANVDGCPNDKGTLPNGCLPGVEPDPDQDGVYGAADQCPNTAGDGALNGCPGGVVIVPDILKPPEQIKTLVATLLTKNGAVFKRASLLKGAPVKFECTLDSAASGTLSISKKVATKLKIKTKKKTLGIASGKGQCKAVGGGSLKLKVLRAYAKKIKKAKKAFPASLAIKLTAPGQIPVTVKRGVKVR